MQRRLLSLHTDSEFKCFVKSISDEVPSGWLREMQCVNARLQQLVTVTRVRFDHAQFGLALEQAYGRRKRVSEAGLEVERLKQRTKISSGLPEQEVRLDIKLNAQLQPWGGEWKLDDR